MSDCGNIVGGAAAFGQLKRSYIVQFCELHLG